MDDSKDELKKCKEDPYYFYKTYIRIDDEVPQISREDFEALWNSVKPKLIKGRQKSIIITSTSKGGNNWIYNKIKQQ